MGNQKQLQGGKAKVGVKDATLMSVTLEAHTGGAGAVTGQSAGIQRASGAGYRQTYHAGDPPAGVKTQDHYSFFGGREDANITSGAIPGSSPFYEANSFTLFGHADLRVIVGGNAIYNAETLTATLSGGDPVLGWQGSADSIASLALEQEDLNLAPIFQSSPPLVQFNGVDQYLHVKYSNVFPLMEWNLPAWSLAIVINADPAHPAEQVILSQGPDLGVGIRVGGEVFMELPLGESISTPPVILDADDVYVLVIVKILSTIKIYVNGQPLGEYQSSPGESLNFPPAPNMVGRGGPQGDSYFAGGLHYMAYYVGDAVAGKGIGDFSRAMDARFRDGLRWVPYDDPEVLGWWDATRYLKDYDLVYQWPDLLGNYTAQTYSNSNNYKPAYHRDGINGRPALYFNGSQNHLTVDPLSPALAGDTGYTISMIVKPTDQAKIDQVFAAFNQGNGGNVTIIGPEGNRIYMFDNAAGASTLSQSTFQNNQILILTWMMDGQTGVHELYVNDFLEISYTSPQRPTPDGKFSFGQEWDGGSLSGFYKGYIGSVLVGKGYSPLLRHRFEAFLAYTYYGPKEIHGQIAMFTAPQNGLGDGDPIVSLPNTAESPQGLNATQADPAKAPTYDAAKKSVYFDLDQYLEIPTAYANSSGSDASILALVSGTGDAIKTEAWGLGTGVVGSGQGVRYTHYDSNGGDESLNLRTALPEGEGVVISASRAGLSATLGKNNAMGAEEKTFSVFEPAINNDNTWLGQDFHGHFYGLSLYNRKLRGYEMRAGARHLWEASPLFQQERPDLAMGGMPGIIQYEFDAQALTGYAKNDKVTALPDISGAAQHAVQADANKQGVYMPYGLAGGPSVFFDGVDDGYTSPALPATGGAPRMVICVVGPQDYPSQYMGIFHWGAHANFQRYCIMSRYNNSYSYAMNGYGSSLGADFLITQPTGGPDIICTSFEGGIFRFWLNGRKVDERALALATGSTFPLNIGHVNNTYMYRGFLSYLMVAKHAPTDAEVGQLTQWLSRRFHVRLPE